MNITEILTQAQMSSDAVTDLLIELAQQNKEVTATAQHMCDLYFADVRLREKGIRDKVAALEKQMTELDTQIRGMQAAVVDAAGTGDADTFAQEQDKLAKIEAQSCHFHANQDAAGGTCTRQRGTLSSCLRCLLGSGKGKFRI